MKDRDLLISRIVDREDTLEDWIHLDRLSLGDDQLYGALVDAMRDESTLRTAVSSAVAVADTVELVTAAPGFFARRPWLPQWSGWMAAAVIALAFLVVEAKHDRERAEVGTPSSRNERGPIAEVGDARGRDRGTDSVSATLAGHTVLRQYPDEMVETRPIPNSDQYEVFYYRRTLERAVVSGAVRQLRDDGGQRVPIAVDLSNYYGRVR